MASKSVLDSVEAWVYHYSNFLILVLVVIVVLYLWVRIPSGLPPCPKWVWPGFAHSLMVKGDLADLFRRLRRQHGDIFSFWLGGQLVIVINGFQNIREFFLGDSGNVAWRPDILNCDLFHYGVICTSGRHWREQRHVTKTAIEYLQDKGLEQAIFEEMKEFISAIKQTQQNALDPRIYIQSSIFTSLCSLLFGHKFDCRDPRVTEGVSHFNENIKLYSDCRLPNFFPFEKFLIGDTFDTKFLRLNMADIHRKLINDECDRHCYGNADAETEDFISLYLQAIQQQENADKEKKEREEKERKASGKKVAKKDEKESTINKGNMQAAAYDILWHGTVTMAGALQWALLFLLHYPDVQIHAQAEIDANFPEGTVPLTADVRQKLPYLEAVVLEVFRLGNVLPFAMAHSVLKEVKFHGYRIPNNAVVVPNLDSVLMDSEAFKNPETFNPERFLDASGRATFPAQYIPFFFGDRSCLGSKISQLTVLTFLFGILQKYDLVPVKGASLPLSAKGYQVVSLPKDYKIRFVPRH